MTVALALGVMIAFGPEPTTSAPPTTPVGPGLVQVTIVGIEFAFDPNEVILSPTASITLDNQGAVVHDISIEGVPDFKVEAQAGTSIIGSINLAPGEYVIFCSIPGHREAGMEGVLLVSAQS